MIHAVILAGGWGRRFWPKSRKNLPKQLFCQGKQHSPLQNLFRLIEREIPKERIWVVVNKVYAQSLRKQLPSLAKKNFLIEPLSRNTACAVGLACVVINRIDPQAVTVILPSDSRIGQKRYFLRSISIAANKAKESDALLTIGIRPNRPAQEYGYLKLARSSKLEARSSKVYKVERFVEKPNQQKAKAYLKSGRYLWNSGIFVWRVSSILQEIKQHLPQLSAGLQRLAKNQGLSNYSKELLKQYTKFKNISIDYGVMERSHNIYTVVGNFPWEDIGSWENFYAGRSHKDKKGNIIQGRHKGIDARNSIICSEGKHLIATLGIRDLIIVHTPSVTLVCKKERAQEVKRLTQILENDKRLRKYL